MAGPTQKEQERFYLDSFLQRIGICAREIRDDEGAVDHHVFIADRKVAVEQVMFHGAARRRKGSARRAAEAQTEALVDTILRKQRDYPGLDGLVGILRFKGQARPHRNQLDAFSDQLLSFAAGQPEALAASSRQFMSFGDAYPLLEQFLASLHLVRVGFTGEWDLIDIDWIGTTQDDLVNAVADKLLFSRPGEVDEWWLLIVSGWRLSHGISHFSVGDLQNLKRLEEKLQRSSYDKVLLFEYIRGRVLQWDHQDGWAEVKAAEDPSQH